MTADATQAALVGRCNTCHDLHTLLVDRKRHIIEYVIMLPPVAVTVSMACPGEGCPGEVVLDLQKPNFEEKL